MRDKPDSNLPPAHLLEALRTHGEVECQDEALPVRRIKERLFTPLGLYKAAKRAREARQPRPSFVETPERRPRPVLGPHPNAVSKGRPHFARPIHRTLSDTGRERIVRRLAREKGIKGVDE